METVTCVSCSASNPLRDDLNDCQSCGVSLELPKAMASLQATTEKMSRLKSAPAKSFYTFNGFGTTLLDYRKREDGLHEATRWVVALMIPLIPLSSYVIRLGAEVRSYGREAQSFGIIEKIPLSPARVLWVYLLVVIAFLPLYLFGYYDYLGLRTLGLAPFLFRGLLPIIWAGFIIFYWLQRK